MQRQFFQNVYISNGLALMSVHVMRKYEPIIHTSKAQLYICILFFPVRFSYSCQQRPYKMVMHCTMVFTIWHLISASWNRRLINWPLLPLTSSQLGLQWNKVTSEIHLEIYFMDISPCHQTTTLFITIQHSQTCRWSAVRWASHCAPWLVPDFHEHKLYKFVCL